MEKKFILTTTRRPGRHRSKRLRGLGVSSPSATSVPTVAPGPGAETGTTGGTDGHTHRNKDLLDSFSADADNYLYIAHDDDRSSEDEVNVVTVTEKVKAGFADRSGHADTAHDLSEDSPVFDKVLRKDRPDRTPYDLSVGGTLLTEAEVRSASFAAGLTGYGFRIDADGNIEADSLTLRKWLEVPYLRFNRTQVTIGNDWRAPGAGVIESVAAVYDQRFILMEQGGLMLMEDGTPIADEAEVEIADEGEIRLKLEDGEPGTFEPGDICMGIFHRINADGSPAASNATEDFDDGRGNFTFAGFTTVYFEVINVRSDNGINNVVRYRLRPGYNVHPCAQMSIVAYGSFTEETRRTSAYSTRTYQRYLAGVDNWEFGEENIMAQFGDLSNLTVNGENLSGYSAYLNNVYFTGVIRQLENYVTYEWDVNPPMIPVDADGWLSEDPLTVAVNCQRRTFNGLSALKPGEIIQVEENGTGKWGIPISDTLTFRNGATRLRELAFRVVDSDGNVLSIHRVPFNRKGDTGDQGDKGDKGSDGTNGTNGSDGKDGKDGSNYTENLLVGTQHFTSPWVIYFDEPPFDNEEYRGLSVLRVNDSKTHAVDITACPVTLEPGKTYTLSFWAKGAGAGSIYFYTDSAVCDSADGILSTNASSVWHYSVEMTVPLVADTWKRFYVSFVAGANASAATAVGIKVESLSTMKACGVKLEDGENHDTVWTPNSSEMIGRDGENGEKGEKGEDGKDGDPGPQGPQGAVTRIRRFETGMQVFDGTVAGGDGVRWLDVVYTVNESQQLYYYRCIDTHVVAEDEDPAKDPAQWAPFSSIDNLIVDLLCASHAKIQFLNSQEITLGYTYTATDGSVVDRITGRIGAPLVANMGGEEPERLILYTGENVADARNATYTLDIDGRTVYGSRTAEHIVIDPIAQEMQVYDAANVRRLTVTGKRQEIDSIYGGSDSVVRTLSESRYSQNTVLDLGRLAVERGLSAKTTLHTLIRMMATLQIKQQSGITGIVDLDTYRSVNRASLNVYRVDPDGEKHFTSKSVALQAYWPPVADMEFVNGWHIETQTDESLLELSDIVLTGLADRDRTEYHFELDIEPQSHSWSSGSSLEATLQTCDYAADIRLGDNYRATFGASGFIVSQSTANYMFSGMRGDSFITEMAAGRFGLRVTEDGLYARDPNGVWRKVKLTFE